MPTYDYVCDGCTYRFEEFQLMTEAPLTKCPKCQKPKLRRLFGTGAAVLFKGSGFYQTDYRSESYKAAARAEAELANGNGSSDKTDSNSSAKTDTNDTPGTSKSGSGGKSTRKMAKSAS